MTPASTEHLREVRTSRTECYQGRLLTLVKDEVVLADGTKSSREIVLHRGAVCIVPVAEDGTIVLVRQWRAPHDRAYWELPAGTREEGEEVEVTARRELSEETGYEAATWSALGECPVSPGYSTEILYYFLATKLTPGEQHTDHDERLDVEAFDEAGLAALIARHDVDMKTLAGLALCGRYPSVRA